MFGKQNLPYLVTFSCDVAAVCDVEVVVAAVCAVCGIIERVVVVLVVVDVT